MKTAFPMTPLTFAADPATLAGCNRRIDDAMSRNRWRTGGGLVERIAQQAAVEFEYDEPERIRRRLHGETGCACGGDCADSIAKELPR